MIGRIGVTLLSSFLATSDIDRTLKRLADRYGRADLRIYVLPTVVLVEDTEDASPTTSFFPVDIAPLRLDQSDAVDRELRRVLRDAPEPKSVVAELARISASPPRFGPIRSVLGHTLLTVGFGMVLNPTITALPVYVILGAVVGTIIRFGSRFPTLSLILPAFTAFAVTLLVSLVVRPLVHDDVLRLVAPSLVSLLPGLILTIAAVELTSGQVIAGASRMVYGVARLGLLAFGVYAGISVAGEPLATTVTPTRLGEWAPWVGIVFVSMGYYLFSVAPRGSLPWILCALVISYASQSLGHLLVGPELSGLIGALIVIPTVHLISHIRESPAPAVMLVCAYWLMVPGSMGFIGLSEAASGTAGATDTLLQTFGSLISIAIGMMLGAGLSRDATVLARGWTKPTLSGAAATSASATASAPE